MKQNGGSSRRGRIGERGQSLVEISVVLGILLVPIVMGMAGTAVYLGDCMQLTDAVSVAAKQLSVNRGLPAAVDPCLLVKNTVNASYQNGASELTTPTVAVTLTVYNASGVITGAANSTGTCTSYAGFMVPGGSVKVSATHTVNSIFPNYGSFITNARSQEYVE